MASVSTSAMQLGYFLRDNCCFDGLKDVIYVYTTTTLIKSFQCLVRLKVMVLPDPILTILLPLIVVKWRGNAKPCPSFPSHQPLAVTGNNYVGFEAITTYP